MDPAHAGCYGLARTALENSRWRLDARGRLYYSYRTAGFPAAEACHAEAVAKAGQLRNKSGEDALSTFTHILARSISLRG